MLPRNPVPRSSNLLPKKTLTNNPQPKKTQKKESQPGSSRNKPYTERKRETHARTHAHANKHTESLERDVDLWKCKTNFYSGLFSCLLICTVVFCSDLIWSDLLLLRCRVVEHLDRREEERDGETRAGLRRGERREGRGESSVLDCAEQSEHTSPSRPVQSSLPDQGGPTSPLVEMVNYI
jgi:hypothetical protein